MILHNLQHSRYTVDVVMLSLLRVRISYSSTGMVHTRYQHNAASTETWTKKGEADPLIRTTRYKGDHSSRTGCTTQGKVYEYNLCYTVAPGHR